MSDEKLHEALNRLAARGEPRGFDSVLAGAADAAADAAERDAAVPESVGRDSASGDLETIPFVTAEPAPRRRRRPLGSIVAAAGIAALLVVGTFAVSAIVGNSGSGSGSPEGAVHRLADALSHEDPLAAAGVLAPEEVRSLQGTVGSAEKKAAELQLVKVAGSPLAGVDFNVDGLKLSTQSLGNGYAKVTVDSGAFTASAHKAQFSPLMQKVLRNSHDNSVNTDLATLAAKERLPTFVIAVKRDGHWYVSAAYTVLEYVREMNKLPAADFGSGVTAIATLGADSPDAAVQESMRALQQQDWLQLLTMVSPNEVPAYDYRGALIALLDRGTTAADRSKPRFTIGSMRTTSAVDGDNAKVTLHASGTTNGGKWSIDGDCYALADTSGAADSSAIDQTASFPCGTEPVALALLSLPFGASKDAPISVVKEGGRWFVSPVGTALDLVDRAVDQLDRKTLYSLLGVPNLLPPDGALTLGKPVVLHAGASDDLDVVTLQGHKGQSLLGLSTSSVKPLAPVGDREGGSLGAVVRVFSPGGSELYSAQGLLYGEPLVLPTDGTYTVVVRAFAVSTAPGAISVTIWNSADAPVAARQPNGPNGSCTYTANSTSCSGSSVGSIGSPGSGDSNGETCTSTANSESCSASVTTDPTPAPTPTAGGVNSQSSGSSSGVEIGNGLSVAGSGTGTSVAVTTPASTAAVASGG